jgi:hypothetical protein
MSSSSKRTLRSEKAMKEPSESSEEEEVIANVPDEQANTDTSAFNMPRRPRPQPQAVAGPDPIEKKGAIDSEDNREERDSSDDNSATSIYSKSKTRRLTEFLKPRKKDSFSDQESSGDDNPNSKGGPAENSHSTCNPLSGHNNANIQEQYGPFGPRPEAFQHFGPGYGQPPLQRSFQGYMEPRSQGPQGP